MASIRRIGFVIKREHREAEQLAQSVAKFLISEKYEVVFTSENRSTLSALKILPAQKKLTRTVLKAALPENTDLIIVFGGDGTYLSIARLMLKKSTPILGVNMGRLGFLTEVKKEEIFETLQEILKKKKLELSERSLLDVTLIRKNKTVFNGPIVNDAVLSKGSIARIVNLQVRINGNFVNEFRADGVIVSTPTGSTAYSLAAGGPIVEPKLNAMIISPICPFSLWQRSLVIADESLIEICVAQKEADVVLTLDGQDAIQMRGDDIVQIRRFQKHSLKLVTSPSRDYFSILREKLNFGGRAQV